MTTSARVALFEVAANPDPDSTLPFLIRLPLSGGELVLKARDSWPRTAKVYCHRADGWPDDPEIIERIPVRSCQRRGVAIDLVLDRPRENRSQLVFTRIQGGREGIFWQSARTTRQARPGIRVPRRRAADLAHLTILVDSRERYPYKFAQQQASTQRRALPAGDYGIAHDGEIVAVVERKSLHDLVRRLIDGQLTYALADIAALPRAAVVVEDRYSNLFKLDFAKPGFVTEMLAALTVRYPTVPIHFAETRPLAEEWTYRFLGAALAYHQAAPRRRNPTPRSPAALASLDRITRIMPEERGELGHPPVDVFAGAVPVEQRSDCERVPEIVRAGTQPHPLPFQAGLADQRWEGSVEHDARQPPAAFAEEERWRDGLGPALIAQPGVLA